MDAEEVLKKFPICKLEIPQKIKECLLNPDSPFTHIDADYAYFGKNEKMRLGRAIREFCEDDEANIYDTWKNEYAIYKKLPIAINEALRRREILGEYKYLEPLTGRYPSKYTKVGSGLEYHDGYIRMPSIHKMEYEWVISNDPSDIVSKSEFQEWQEESCERIGGEYGNPSSWLKGGEDCGYCSDIEHGNLIMYLFNKTHQRWEGRAMLRWCNTDLKDTIGLGIERNWYGNMPTDEHEKERFELLNELAEKNNIAIRYFNCVTPYKYAGYSDETHTANGQLNYKSKDIDNPLYDAIRDRLEPDLKGIISEECARNEVNLISTIKENDIIEHLVQYKFNPDNPLQLEWILADTWITDDYICGRTDKLIYHIGKTIEWGNQNINKLYMEEGVDYIPMEEWISRNFPMSFFYSQEEWDEFMDVKWTEEDKYSIAKLNWDRIKHLGDIMIEDSKKVRYTMGWDKGEAVLALRAPRYQNKPPKKYKTDILIGEMNTFEDLEYPYKMRYDIQERFLLLMDEITRNKRVFKDPDYSLRRREKFFVMLDNILRKYRVDGERLWSFYQNKYLYETFPELRKVYGLE